MPYICNPHPRKVLANWRLSASEKTDSRLTAILMPDCIFIDFGYKDKTFVLYIKQ